MRAARPAHRAEAPHERGEREEDDLAFGELFEALRSSLVPSVGTTDAHAKKATMDASPRAARARLDQWWTARREGDVREHHERRLASIRASLACVARRRDAFGDRVRASLARVLLEEDAACGVSAARAEAMAARAESVAGAWRAETLGNAAESVAGCMREVTKARDALLAAHDERSLLAFARGVVGAGTKVAPAKDLAFAPVEALVREVLQDTDEDEDESKKTRLWFQVTSIVSLDYDADADDGVGVALQAATRAFLADFVPKPKNESEKPAKRGKSSPVLPVEATFATRQKKTRPLRAARQSPSRWGACLVPLTAARGADASSGGDVKVDIASAARGGVRLSSSPRETPSSMSLRRPRSTGSRATFCALGSCGDVSSDDSTDDSESYDSSDREVGFPPETRLASFAAASLGVQRDPRVFALYDFERDESSEDASAMSETDANQVRAWDERFRRRRVATVAHLRRVLEERREPDDGARSKDVRRRARLGLCVLVETRHDKKRRETDADGETDVRGDCHSLGENDDDQSPDAKPRTAVTEARVRFVPVTERALAELARSYLSRRARKALLRRGADAAPRRVRGSNPDENAPFSLSSSHAQGDAGGVSIALVYEETAARDASATSEGKTVKPVFLASVRARREFIRGAEPSGDSNEPDAPRTPERTTSTRVFSCREVVSAIAEAASVAAAEHAGDGGRADRFPRDSKFLESETVSSDAFFRRVGLARPPRVAPRDWSARDEELDAAAEALGDAEEELEALRASRVLARNALRERNE